MNSKEPSEVWTEPELIVLVRSKPEEAVLDTCKTSSGAFKGPLTTDGYCMDEACSGFCLTSSLS
jgi:hypothetical protein